MRMASSKRPSSDSAMAPSEATQAHFDEASRYFDEGQVVEIVASIALFGFLNRWNASLGTALEPQPLGFARNRLGARGWKPGVHGGGQAD